MKQKKSGMVMSIGRQLPHMLTPFSFISFVCSAWKRLGSLAYFFCSRCISGCTSAIFAEDLRVFISENMVSARRSIVLINMVRNTLPKPLADMEQVRLYIQRIASRNQFVKKKSPVKVYVLSFPPRNKTTLARHTNDEYFLFVFFVFFFFFALYSIGPVFIHAGCMAPWAKAELLRNGIVPAPRKRVAAQYAPQRKQAALQRAETAYGLLCISRARGDIAAAGRMQRRYPPLVSFYKR